MFLSVLVLIVVVAVAVAVAVMVVVVVVVVVAGRGRYRARGPSAPWGGATKSVRSPAGNKLLYLLYCWGFALRVQCTSATEYAMRQRCRSRRGRGAA